MARAHIDSTPDRVDRGRSVLEAALAPFDDVYVVTSQSLRPTDRQMLDAWDAGYHSRVNDICPYTDKYLREEWFTGSNDALADRLYAKDFYAGADTYQPGAQMPDNSTDGFRAGWAARALEDATSPSEDSSTLAA